MYLCSMEMDDMCHDNLVSKVGFDVMWKTKLLLHDTIHYFPPPDKKKSDSECLALELLHMKALCLWGKWMVWWWACNMCDLCDRWFVIKDQFLLKLPRQGKLVYFVYFGKHSGRIRGIWWSSRDTTNPSLFTISKMAINFQLRSLLERHDHKKRHDTSLFPVLLLICWIGCCGTLCNGGAVWLM